MNNIEIRTLTEPTNKELQDFINEVVYLNFILPDCFFRKDIINILRFEIGGTIFYQLFYRLIKID